LTAAAPPSTFQAQPVTKLARAEARNATTAATSRPSPMRPSGMRETRCACISASDLPVRVASARIVSSRRSEWTTLGMTALMSTLFPGEIARKCLDQVENGRVVEPDRHRRRLRLARCAPQDGADAPPSALTHQRRRKADAACRSVELVVEQLCPLHIVERKAIAAADHGRA